MRSKSMITLAALGMLSLPVPAFPQPTTAAAAVSSASDWVSRKDSKDGLRLIDGTLNGVVATARIDTGVADVILNQRFATARHLDGRPIGQGYSVGGIQAFGATDHVAPPAKPLQPQTTATANEKLHLRDLATRLDTICARSGSPCPRLTLDDRTMTPLERRQNQIVVSSRFANLARSPVEDLAFAALVVAWFNQRDPAMKSQLSDLPQQLLAIGTIALGETIDPIANPVDRARRSGNVQYRGSAVPQPSPMVAQRALALAESAGSCSGALVNLLNRAKSKNIETTQGEREQDLFAKSLLSQLGSSILPPDSSCVHGSAAAE